MKNLDRAQSALAITHRGPLR